MSTTNLLAAAKRGLYYLELFRQRQKGWNGNAFDDDLFIRRAIAAEEAAGATTVHTLACNEHGVAFQFGAPLPAVVQPSLRDLVQSVADKNGGGFPDSYDGYCPWCSGRERLVDGALRVRHDGACPVFTVDGKVR